jgi:hypothetical protein
MGKPSTVVHKKDDGVIEEPVTRMEFGLINGEVGTGIDQSV